MSHGTHHNESWSVQHWIQVRGIDWISLLLVNYMYIVRDSYISIQPMTHMFYCLYVPSLLTAHLSLAHVYLVRDSYICTQPLTHTFYSLYLTCSWSAYLFFWWMSHVSREYMNESWHTYEWVLSYSKLKSRLRYCLCTALSNVHTHTHTNKCIWSDTHSHIHTHTYIYTYNYAKACIFCFDRHVHKHLQACTYISTHTHTHTHTHQRIQIPNRRQAHVYSHIDIRHTNDSCNTLGY